MKSLFKIKLIIIPTLIIVSFLIGIFVAVSNINSSAQNNEFSIKNGNWIVNPNMDLQNNFQRAYVSRIGVFALDEKEALYFLSNKDSKGRILSSKYDYEIIGIPPTCRYWSYTLYGENYFLVKNKINKFSINKENFEESHSIMISSSKKKINWLPSANEKQFHITLRLYNPNKEVYSNIEVLELPIIKRIEK
tara:strand:+ start:88261 stop:88836 length:576 start_codon:yes stop_codon:yes gene_type:complete